MIKLDCRKMTCPNPVIKTKEAIDNGATDVSVMVDNQAAMINVSNLFHSQGFSVETSGQEPEFSIRGIKDDSLSKTADECEVIPFGQTGNGKILVMICKDKIGEGDDTLGQKLMLAYLSTLKEMGDDLWRIVFLNSGVKLSVEGSEALTALNELSETGVSILVCGTCLDYYNLLDEKKVGETTNMLDIVTSLQLAGKVISLT